MVAHLRDNEPQPNPPEVSALKVITREPQGRHVSDDQVAVISRLFRGRTDVYGTYDFATKRVWQVKQPVTPDVIKAHLNGIRPLGVYPLVKDVVSFAAVDFDTPDQTNVTRFTAVARASGLVPHIERSKSKGHHCWFFFVGDGVEAKLVRATLARMLREVGLYGVEVFPKQDRLTPGEYGNFINLPLFGASVAEEKTVFVDQEFQPYPDQWSYLSLVSPTPAHSLIPENTPSNPSVNPVSPAAGRNACGIRNFTLGAQRTWGLPPCSQRMLREGVPTFQRVACFRLAVALRKTGLPFHAALSVLTQWAHKNLPNDGKPTISENEVIGQARSAYGARTYQSYGCSDAAVKPFCEKSCWLFPKQFHDT